MSSVPQIGGMYRGDRSRKETLVEFGFRLPSALDNRPLELPGVRGAAWGNDVVYVSATPGPVRAGESPAASSSSRLIRPTGLKDPEVIIVRPAGAASR